MQAKLFQMLNKIYLLRPLLHCYLKRISDLQRVARKVRISDSADQVARRKSDRFSL